MKRSSKSISASDSASIKLTESINEINLQSTQSTAVIVFVFSNKSNLNEKISNVDQCIDQAENAIIETKNSSEIVSSIQSIQRFSHVEILEVSAFFSARNLSKESIIKEHHNDKSSKKISQMAISPKTKADKEFNESQIVAS